MNELILLVVSGVAFGGVWWGLSKITANAFVIAAVSFFAGLLIYASQSIFGYKL